MHPEATLSAAEFERLSEAEAELLIRARFVVLMEAGSRLEDAVVVATHPEVELARALPLLRRGCPGRTALRILL